MRARERPRDELAALRRALTLARDVLRVLAVMHAFAETQRAIVSDMASLNDVVARH